MSFSKPAKYERFYWGGGGDGDAYYSKHLAALLCPLLEEVKPRLTSAIDKIPFSSTDGKPFTIADYGCRDGGISGPVFQHLIDYMRQDHKSSHDIHIMYEDQPYCDFKSLFVIANGLTGAAYEPAWSRQKNVYFSAVGRSFFEKCFPRNSVHVGFSSHAVLHLSKRPCLLSNVLHIALSTDEKEKALFAKQAASDWETFLCNRCSELAPGGVLFVVAFYTMEDGQYPCGTEGGRNYFQDIHTIWKQLYQEGKITKEELEEPTYNFYYRTVEDFRAPLLNKDSAVYQEGLRLVSLETKFFPCGFQAKLKECGLMDPAVISEQAHGFATAMRAWSSGDFLAALSSRPETERMEIVDELFQRWEDQVRAEPTLHRLDMPVVHIMMRKISQ